MVLGNLPVPGHPAILITVGQGPTALAVGAGGGCLDIFSLIYPFSPLSPSLWKTARYRLKYCLKGPLNPKQPTNQPSKLYRQIVGIPMGTNCAPLVADLFLFCYERDFMLSLSDANQSGVIEAFNSTSRFLDDLLNIDNNFFDSMVNRIYPSELQLNKANVADAVA